MSSKTFSTTFSPLIFSITHIILEKMLSLIQSYYKRDRYGFQFNESSNDSQFFDTYITVLDIYVNTEPLDIGDYNGGHNN